MKTIVEDHPFHAPVVKSEEQKSAIEADEFNLIMKQIDYDVTVYENWVKKCTSVYAAREHAMQQFKLDRMKQAQS